MFKFNWHFNSQKKSLIDILLYHDDAEVIPSFLEAFSYHLGLSWLDDENDFIFRGLYVKFKKKKFDKKFMTVNVPSTMWMGMSY